MQAGRIDAAPRAAARLGPVAPRKLRARVLTTLRQLLQLLASASAEFGAAHPRPGNFRGSGSWRSGRLELGKAVCTGRSDPRPFRSRGGGPAPLALPEMGAIPIGVSQRGTKPKALRQEPPRAFCRVESLEATQACLQLRGGLWLCCPRAQNASRAPPSEGEKAEPGAPAVDFLSNKPGTWGLAPGGAAI